MRSIEISESTYLRLEEHISGFRETEENVIIKALDALELSQKKNSQKKSNVESVVSQLHFNSNQIPNLYHSKPISMKVDGVMSHIKNWNELLYPILRIAIDRGLSNLDLKHRYALNVMKDSGINEKYHFVPTIGLWVQPMSSNDIMKRVKKIVNDLGIELEIEIRWHQNIKAQFPGREARIQINKS